MNNDLDFDNEDLGFEDFDGEFEEFDEFEADDVFVRTAVLSKNNMIALLCVKTATEGGAICRVDPRETQPAVQLYDDHDLLVAKHRQDQVHRHEGRRDGQVEG